MIGRFNVIDGEFRRFAVAALTLLVAGGCATESSALTSRKNSVAPASGGSAYFASAANEVASEVPAGKAPAQPAEEAPSKKGRRGVRGMRGSMSDAPQADLGFRPTIDGFTFENYGNEAPVYNLTPREMFRLFGDGAFAFPSGWVLTPPALRWMWSQNHGMKDGHCEGMAVVSLLFYANRLAPADFGASRVADLRRENNEALQREIAHWFVTQSTSPASRAEIKNRTPVEIVELLAESFRRGISPDHPLYTIGIRKRNGSGGHAMTPYAIREPDPETFEILNYDNNYPNQVRVVRVDRNANTWEYNGASRPDIPPDLYEGDAQTFSLTIIPTPPRTGRQWASFLGFAPYLRGQSVNPSENPIIEVALIGNADLLITDPSGRRVGQSGGQFVNEIPGAEIDHVRGTGLASRDVEPRYFLPGGVEYTIALDGSRLSAPAPSDLSVFGAGWDLAVDEVNLDPGQVDRIRIAPDGSRISYSPGSAEAPELVLGFTSEGDDYEVEVASFEAEVGGEIELAYADGRVVARSVKAASPSTLDIKVTSYSEKGAVARPIEAITLEPGQSHAIELAR